MNLIPSRHALRSFGAVAVWCLGTLSANCWAQVDATANAPETKTPASSGYFTTPGSGASTTSSQPGTLTLPGQSSSPTAAPTGQLPLPISPNTQGTKPTLTSTGVSGVSRQPRSEALNLEPATPLPPTEFQKFVEGAVGRLLPAFGSSFFTASRNGNVVENIPVSSDYMVGPGDELLIRAWGSIDVDYSATIDRNGQVTLPKVGSFTVTGTKASELEKHLRSQIGRFFTNFQLSVTLGQLRGLSVFVVGPAYKPGVYKLPSQSTLLSAVVAAGGPSPTGSMRKISLKREGKVISELDMYEFLVLGDKSKDMQLANGDVVVFLPAGPQVALSGAVDTPAIFELRQAQEPLGNLLRYAGNLPSMANPRSARLERIDITTPRSARSIESVQLDGPGLSKSLRDGDVLTVLPISPAFSNAVTLRGYVAEASRHPHSQGMRVLDLIPNVEALISFDFYRRTNVLVQAGTANTPQRNLAKPLLEEVNWDYATVERLNPQDLTPQIIPFNLGKALLQGDPTQNLALLPGDVVTIYSRHDIRGPTARQTRLVSIEGEVMAPGVYQLAPGETLKSLLSRAGGFTPQAYIYGLEFTREETRRQQRENLDTAIARLEALAVAQSAREASRSNETTPSNALSITETSRRIQLARLSKLEPNGRIALELPPETQSIDELPDLPLENSDRISVPSRPGFVTVGGAVANVNAYLWKPGRTVGDYIKLAGMEESSDPSNIFILRADGTVKHAADQSGFLGIGNFESQRLYPGDAVVVPNKLDYETWGRALVRNLKDWSQIFYQFGIGAAAIKTFKN